MFEEESSQDQKKGELPKVPTNETASPTSNWLQKISQWFSFSKKTNGEGEIKKKLHQLEKARNAERKILLEQRDFYEKLFSKSPDSRHEKKTHIFGKSTKESEPIVPSAPLPPSKPIEQTIPVPPPAPVDPQPPHLIVKPPVSLTLENETPTVPTTSESSIISQPLAPAQTQQTSLPPVPTPSQKKIVSLGFFKRLFSKDLTTKLAEERKREEILQERNSVEQRFWQPSNGIKPNLIKDQEIVFFNWHENILVLSLSLVMCCLAISLIYVGLLIWQKERVEASKTAFLNVTVIDNQIKKSEQEVEEVKKFNKKLTMVSGLLDNHVYWTNFLTLLEYTTLKDVYYERFTGDISGEYTIPAVASSLEAISLQLDVMKKYDNVESVAPDTGQTSADGKSVQFNLGLTVDPIVFTKK
jgi:hypothetical protein